jgi:FkbM family methyltransferase
MTPSYGVTFTRNVFDEAMVPTLMTSRILRKSLASFLKRFFILTSGGYSIGSAYGARFLFDWRHSLDKKVALELYERDQINYLGDSLDRVRPDMFVDIGSHAALYSIVLKTRFPDLEVHAFEPDRTNLCQLYANLFVNKLQNSIMVHEHGLSDINGKVTFDTSEATSSRGTRRISSSGNVEIVVKRLDDVLAEKDRTVAIKIDVEGHECQVIDGARHFLGSNRCFIQVESSPENFGLLSQKLNDLGYRLVASLSDHFFSNIDSFN